MISHGDELVMLETKFRARTGGYHVAGALGSYHIMEVCSLGARSYPVGNWGVHYGTCVRCKRLPRSEADSCGRACIFKPSA